MPFVDRRALAAGDHEAVEAVELARACAPRRRRQPSRSSARACASKSPWIASTPMRGRRARRSRAGGSPRRYQPRCWSRLPSSSSLTSSPGIASPSASEASAIAFGSSKCVVACDDRARPRRRVLRLEDARADEHALGAELHHQRGVGRAWRGRRPRSSRPAGGPRRRPAAPARAARAAPSPRAASSALVHRAEPPDARTGSRACGARPRRRCRCRPRPWCGSSPRPRRSGAAPRRDRSRRTRTAP